MNGVAGGQAGRHQTDVVEDAALDEERLQVVAVELDAQIVAQLDEIARQLAGAVREQRRHAGASEIGAHGHAGGTRRAKLDAPVASRQPVEGLQRRAAAGRVGLVEQHQHVHVLLLVVVDGHQELGAVLQRQHGAVRPPVGFLGHHFLVADGAFISSPFGELIVVTQPFVNQFILRWLFRSHRTGSVLKKNRLGTEIFRFFPEMKT